MPAKHVVGLSIALGVVTTFLVALLVTLGVLAARTAFGAKDAMDLRAKPPDSSLRIPLGKEARLSGAPLPTEFHLPTASLLFDVNLSAGLVKGGPGEGWGEAMAGIHQLEAPFAAVRRNVEEIKMSSKNKRSQKRYPSVYVNDVQGSPETAVVFFRGLSGSWEAKHLLQYATMPKPSWLPEDSLARVHGGFLRLYDTLRPELLKSLEGKRRVFLTGFSLGGMMAMLAAADLAQRSGEDRVEIYGVTFGASTVGNSYLREALGEAKFFRVNNMADFIGLVPFSSTPTFRARDCEKMAHYVPACPLVVYWRSDPDASLVDAHSLRYVRWALVNNNLTVVTPVSGQARQL